MESTILDRLCDVQERINAAALGCGRRPEEIRLVAVGKTQPADSVRLAIEAGAGIIGENYIQESREKFDALIDQSVQWHFIGHLQRNKAKYAVRLFDLIHTVDSVRLATELDKQAGKVGKHQAVLVQVNISGETSKSGADESEVLELVRHIASLEHLAVKGLMTMPPFFDAPEKARPYFAALRHLRDKIRAQMPVDANPNIKMDELSMGMTGDFEVAIQEGATLVRVGTAIFGARS